MRFSGVSIFVGAATFVEALTKGGHDPSLPQVNGPALEQAITESALSTKAQELQDIAYSTPNRNRVMSSIGYHMTVEWIAGYLDEMSEYYNYEIQPFIALYSEGNATLSVDDEDIPSAEIFEYSPGGVIEAEFVLVDNEGCDPSDYPDEIADQIALISRGTCEFGLKSALAGAAGAAAAVIFNDEAGPVGGGTLGPPPRPEGEYIPTVGIARAAGTAIVDVLDVGETATGVLDVYSDIRNVTTYNVIAETVGGDHDNVLVLGAHADSVFDGPGINDDGSGTIGILTTAIELSKYSTNNAVRFCWWSGEEFGLLGSTHYVETLNDTAADLAKIKLYLNFDMIASPNFIYATFDGDGSAYNLTGPPGSAEVEHFYERWFESNGLNHTATAFDGRSDYQAFADNGIPCGGLFTGADETKTAKQVEMFGGVAGEIMDPNYHTEFDTYDNLNFTAFLTMTKAMAASVAEYATSFESLSSGNSTGPSKAKRSMRLRGVGSNKVRKGHKSFWKI